MLSIKTIDKYKIIGKNITKKLILNRNRLSTHPSKYVAKWIY